MAERRARIMFVDDEVEILAALRNRFRRQVAWEVVFMDSAEAALEALAGSPFDLVVSDMRMPGMNGAELLRRVATTYPHVARIALTGEVGEEGCQVREYAHVMLYKPCDGAQLRAAIDELLTRASAPACAAAAAP
jgi:DNA-binding NtrC family response regulator